LRLDIGSKPDVCISCPSGSHSDDYLKRSAIYANSNGECNACN
jgi:hypothetical protein